MISSTNCDTCGDLMDANLINRENSSECTQYYCSKCGNHYETGFRCNSLIKQFVKYIRFNP
ncbi:MAG: hypothetical protein ACFFE5_16645 [Candidatus Thorarchaeota archaeon]